MDVKNGHFQDPFIDTIYEHLQPNIVYKFQKWTDVINGRQKCTLKMNVKNGHFQDPIINTIFGTLKKSKYGRHKWTSQMDIKNGRQ